MTNKKTIEFESPDGYMVEIEVEQFSSIESMRRAAEFPADATDDSIDIETIDYMIDIATDQTVLTEELLNEFDKSELGELLGKIVSTAFGNTEAREDSNDSNDDGVIGFQ
jgi:hypothetical protein